MATPQYKALYQSALDEYSPGGSFLEAAKANIAEGLRKTTAAGRASNISAGLGGTTVMAGTDVAAGKAATQQTLQAEADAGSIRANIAQRFGALMESSRQAELERLSQEQRTQTLAGVQTRGQDVQLASAAAGRPRTPGLDAFGQPMSGTMASQQAQGLTGTQSPGQLAGTSGGVDYGQGTQWFGDQQPWIPGYGAGVTETTGTLALEGGIGSIGQATPADYAQQEKDEAGFQNFLQQQNYGGEPGVLMQMRQQWQNLPDAVKAGYTG